MRHSLVAALFLIGCFLAPAFTAAAPSQQAATGPTGDPTSETSGDGQRFEIAFLAGGGPGTVKDAARTSTNLTEAIVRFAINLPEVGGGRRGSTFGIMIELVPYFAVDQEPRATGAGATLMFRYMYAGEHWRPMIVLGTGIVKTDELVPAGEAKKNYMPQGGLGLQYIFNATFGIDIEYRFHHMSNNSQTENNPGIDAQMVLFGLVWSF